MNELTKCLCCDATVVPLIDFGDMPLVNTYGVKEKFPLSVWRCVSCCHLQLGEFVDPNILYRDYAYCSGTGRTALDYFKWFAKTALSYFPEAKTVLDIACNDASQLDAFHSLGMETHGIDPSDNLASIAIAKGNHCIATGFFEDQKELWHKHFDIITAQNVVAHTPRPLEFLRKCHDMMHEESRLFIATSQANMIVNGEADTIYHEHVSYFNAHSMAYLAEAADLVILDILMHDIHGTSFIFVLGKAGHPSIRVADRLEWEFQVGMMGVPLYRWWHDHVQSKKIRIQQTVVDYYAKGYYMVGLGAAAKGISILNMAGVKLDLLVDSTPSKWGHMTSGMEIAPFGSISALTHKKILFVVLAWNVHQEIVSNCLKLRDNPNDVFVELR